MLSLLVGGTLVYDMKHSDSLDRVIVRGKNLESSEEHLPQPRRVQDSMDGPFLIADTGYYDNPLRGAVVDAVRLAEVDVKFSVTTIVLLDMNFEDRLCGVMDEFYVHVFKALLAKPYPLDWDRLKRYFFSFIIAGYEDRSLCMTLASSRCLSARPIVGEECNC